MFSWLLQYAYNIHRIYCVYKNLLTQISKRVRNFEIILIHVRGHKHSVLRFMNKLRWVLGAKRQSDYFMY